MNQNNNHCLRYLKILLNKLISENPETGEQWTEISRLEELIVRLEKQK